MSNFVIKPNTLLPSTYSSIGSVLTPSKTCSNKNISRKYDNKVSQIQLLPNGTRVLDKSYISTFKQFDRPSVIISSNCQDCVTQSVPTVTDKAVYPCSRGKYSVSKYSDFSNNIDYLGNSSNIRISISNNQLYQQYRYNYNVNNITCPFILDTGFYKGAVDTPGVIILNGLNGKPYLYILINTFESEPVLLNLSSNCTQTFTLEVEEGIFFEFAIVVTSSNTFSITGEGGGTTIGPLSYTSIPLSNADNNEIEPYVAPIVFSDCIYGNETHTITSIVENSNIITIIDNGVTINLENYYEELGSRLYITDDGTTVYLTSIVSNPGYEFIIRITALSRCSII